MARGFPAAFPVRWPFAGLLGTTRMKRVFLSYLWRMTPAKLAAYRREFAKSLMPAIYPELRNNSTATAPPGIS